MALTRTDRGIGQIGNSSAASHVVTSSSFTPAANALLVVVSGGFANGAGSTFDATVTDTFAGGGAWTHVNAATTVYGSYGVRNKISYRQVGASPGAGTITVTRTPSGTLDCFMAAQFLEYGGHDTTTPIQQSNTGTGLASTLNANLTTPVATNTVIASLVDIFPGTPGLPAGYTQLSVATAPAVECKLVTAYDAASAGGTIQWSALNVNANAAVSIEVKMAPVGAATVTLVPQFIDFSNGVKLCVPHVDGMDYAQFRSIGGTHVLVVIGWDVHEATEGTISSTEIGFTNTRLTNVRNAGLTPILAFGVQYPPAWVKTAVPQFKNQVGELLSRPSDPGQDVRDWVFTSIGRTKVQNFYTRVAAAGLNFTGVESIQVGGGWYNELHYPAWSWGTQAVNYWGYSTAAQTGTGIASGIDVCPSPGYVFGSGTTLQDNTWKAWYLESMARFGKWQVDTIRALGWGGPIHMLHPGWGIRSTHVNTDTVYRQEMAEGNDWGLQMDRYMTDSNAWPHMTWANYNDTGAAAITDDLNNSLVDHLGAALMDGDGADSSASETNMAPWRKGLNLATERDRTRLLWAESAAGASSGEMNFMFGSTGPVTKGFYGVEWVDWPALLAGGGTLAANMKTKMQTAAMLAPALAATAAVNLVPQTITLTPQTFSLVSGGSGVSLVPQTITLSLTSLTLTKGSTTRTLVPQVITVSLGLVAPSVAGSSQTVPLSPIVMNVLPATLTVTATALPGTEPPPLPPNVGLPTVYSTAIPPTFLQELVFGPIVTRRRRVDIYMPDGETPFMLDAPLIGGTVTVDMARDERRMCDIVLDNEDRKLDHYPDGFWYDNILKIYHGVETPDAIWETQIGEFMIDSIREPHFPYQVAVKGRDYAKKLLLDEFPAATAFTKGQGVGNVVKIIATNAWGDNGINGIVKMNVFDDGETLVSDFTFERKTSRWEAITKLADAHSLEVFFDRFGYLVLRRYRDPQSSPLAFSFLTGAAGNLATYEKEANDAWLKNHVVVTGAATANNIPVFAEAENTNPASAASTYRIGRRTLNEESAFIGTVAQAKQRADQLLATAGLESYSIDLGAIVAPWLEEGNAIEFLDPRQAIAQPTRYLLTSFDIPLALGTMNAHGKRLTIVTSTGAERRPPGYGVSTPPITPPTPGESVAPVVTQQPTNTLAAAGTQFTLSAAASGSPTPTVQWQNSSTGTAGPFNNITGATSPTYTAVATNAVNGYYYRAVFTNTLGVTQSNPVQITITASVPAGNPGKARLAWYYFDSANPPSDAVITAWAPQLALAILHPKMTATRNKIKAANPNCRVLAAKSIWSVRTDETLAPFTTAVSYAQAQTNSWLAQTGTPTGGASSNTLPASLSGTHGSATKKILPLVAGLPSYWGSDYLNDELQRYRAAQTVITGSTSAVMTGAVALPIDNIPTGYKSGAVNTWDNAGDTNSNGIHVGDYVQGRVKMPSGKGFWPALWLSDWEGGNNMEIDIMEMLGHQPTVIYETVHENNAQTGQLVKSATPAGVYHTFGVWLRPTGSVVELFINGTSQGTLPYNPTGPTSGKWLAIVNLAIGGSWPGAPDGSTVFPSTLELTELARWRP